MSSAEDAREAVEAAIWQAVTYAIRNAGKPSSGRLEAHVKEALSRADAYARTASDAVTEADEARYREQAASGQDGRLAGRSAAASPAPVPVAGPGRWLPGFVHLATDGGIACNNRAPIPASKITTDPQYVSCSVCRHSRKFKAAKAVA